MPAEPSEQRSREPEEHERNENEDVRVGGQREDPARLLDTAQVCERDEQDDHETHRDAMLRQPLELGDRDDGRDTGRHRHRDGEDVIDHERRARDQRRVFSEVLAAHDVGTAAARVGEDRLAVRDRDQDQQHVDRERDRNELREAEREARATDGDDEENLLGRVRGGGNRVGREDRERDRLRDALVFLLRGCDRPAYEQPLERVEHGG